jgi:hypothetical protein
MTEDFLKQPSTDSNLVYVLKKSLMSENRTEEEVILRSNKAEDIERAVSEIPHGTTKIINGELIIDSY